MPDIVDKVFDYSTQAAQGTSAVLKGAYSVSKDAAQYSYDVSKEVGGRVLDGASKVADKVQETVPDKLNWIKGTISTSISQPAPETDISFIGLTGIACTNLKRSLINNSTNIGIGISIPIVGYTAYQMYRYYKPYVRIAERLPSNKRFEVILVIGSMNSTFVSKLVDDLNIRGYVVFVTVSDESELRMVEEINDSDIKPLFVDYSNDTTIKNSLLKLGKFLDTKIDSVETENYYNFKGVLVIPDYSKLPKIKKLEELTAKDFTRATSTFFLKFNSLLSNGILTFIRESNRRREIVENFNSMKISGGYSKLLFINFMVIPNNDTRRLVHNLAFDINHVFFNKLYEENSISFSQSISRLLIKSDDFDKVDMATLDVFLHKNHNSTIIPDSPIFEMFAPLRKKKLSPKEIHHKVFDLLNQSWLSKEYKLEN